jgi:hypothetical protein
VGLIKEIESGSGIIVSYWKITDWKINQTARAIDIILTPYISNEKRKEGYDPVRDEIRKVRASDYFKVEGYSYNRSDYTDYFSPAALERAAKEGKTIYNVMYEYIKTHAPEFELAEDSF